MPHFHHCEKRSETQIHLTLSLIEPNISRTLFFSNVINEWNKVDLIRGSSSYWLFRKSNPY